MNHTYVLQLLINKDIPVTEAYDGRLAAPRVPLLTPFRFCPHFFFAIWDGLPPLHPSSQQVGATPIHTFLKSSK